MHVHVINENKPREAVSVKTAKRKQSSTYRSLSISTRVSRRSVSRRST